jgi:glycosyltransferase involved in cell wall biosynthesis
MTASEINPEKLLSVISLSHYAQCPITSAGFTDFPFYTISHLNPEPDMTIRGLRKADGGSVDVQAIETPWVLFLEDDEFLLAKEREELLDYCKRDERKITELIIERYLTRDELKSYAWVTTREAFEYASRATRRYLTSETRLIPSSCLREIHLCRSSDRCKANTFIVEMRAAHNNHALPHIIVSRKESKEPDPQDNNRPKDRDIFKHGHQKYFDDTVYSPRFGWPHTVYNTLRLDHVPSVIEALKAGLSNPDIVLFTLAYLIRFKNFSKASEVMNLIPDHWCERHPALLNIVATLQFINGNNEKSLSLFQHALKLFPDLDWLAQNAIKFNLLLDRHDAVDEILCNYKSAAGNELADDYLSHYRAIHEGLPERTATVSMCMVIKDEERNIERAITSAKPMVDELIVIDTGSTDSSVSIAERLGAQVYHYQWCDDFSAARNFAISKASCDYIFMLDGDEYIPPFYFLECQTFKKLLPLDKLRAFKLAIGNYSNETDWLFVVTEKGNFKRETESTRIFPRLDGMKYTGIIGETIDPFLLESAIPTQILPGSLLHIIHGAEGRQDRIERKCHIFNKMDNPDRSRILFAIREFASIGKTDDTLQWLKYLFNNYGEADTNMLKMSIHLARLLQAGEPLQAEQLYQQLMKLYPDEKSVTLAYADYLITSNQIAKIQYMSIDQDNAGTKRERHEEINLECLKSLKHFESGDLEGALDILTNVLESSSSHLFAQSLRFYYLITMNEIEGAVSSLDTLFDMLRCRRHSEIDSIQQMIIATEDLCSALLSGGYFKERSLVLQGILIFGKQWE